MPLGLPVLPDVYSTYAQLEPMGGPPKPSLEERPSKALPIKASASVGGETLNPLLLSGIVNIGQAALSFCRLKTAAAPTSSNITSTLSAGISRSTGTYVAPDLTIPKIIACNSRPRCHHTPTYEPRPIPFFARYAATASLHLSSSA